MRYFRMLTVLVCVALGEANSQNQPAYWQSAPTPPLGWNSWDIFGTTVTEQQIKEQADAMAVHLLPSGYQYLTVDIQWYEPEAKSPLITLIQCSPWTNMAA